MNSSTDLEYYRRVDFDRIKQHGYVPILSLAKWRSMVGDLVKSETNIVEDTHQQMDDVILIEDAKRYIAKLYSNRRRGTIYSQIKIIRCFAY